MPKIPGSDISFYGEIVNRSNVAIIWAWADAPEDYRNLRAVKGSNSWVFLVSRSFPDILKQFFKTDSVAVFRLVDGTKIFIGDYE